MAEYVWVLRACEINKGEVPVDLHQCRKFAVTGPPHPETRTDLSGLGYWLQWFPGEDVPEHITSWLHLPPLPLNEVANETIWDGRLAYYRVPDGESGCWWFSVTQRPKGEMVVVEEHPMTVAHDLLWRGDFDLPPELEPYREVAEDPEAYNEWVSFWGGPWYALIVERISHSGEDEPSPKPRWDAEARKLWVGSMLARAYLRNNARRQCEILEKFEETGWEQGLRLDWLDKEVRDTVSHLNEGIDRDSGLEFKVNNRQVYWRVRQSRSSSP